MKKISILFVLSFLSQAILAQTSETIISSRPGQAFTPAVVGTKIFQVQSGFTLDKQNGEPFFSVNTFVFANQFRFGLSEKFEIRANLSYLNLTSETTDFKATIDGLNAVNIGFKYAIVTGEGRKPSLAFQTDIILPVASFEFRPNTPAPVFYLLHTQQISNTFTLSTNWSVGWNGFTTSPFAGYVLNLSFPLGQKLSGFIENYGGLSTDGDFSNKWDTGLAYLLNNDFQLDFSGGYGRQNDFFNTDQWFVDAGVSFRFLPD